MYLNDEDTARMIVKTMEGMDKGEGCSLQLLCRVNNTHVIVKDHEQSISEYASISGTSSNGGMIMNIITMIMFIPIMKEMCI